MIDIRQSPEYAKYMELVGWSVERIDNVNYFIKKLPLIGSLIKIQRPEKISYKVIELLSKKYRAFQIAIEPKNSYQLPVISQQFKLSKSPFLPTKTVHINLTKSQNQLLNEMHYKTRYNIKKARMSKLKTQKSDDIESFAKFWNKESLKQGRFIPQDKEIKGLFKAFGKKANLLLALYSDELVAGLLILHANKISYYMYAASSEVGKKLFAPTLLAWEVIKLSKNRGSKIFDFEGIYDERFPLPSWLGFTRFKKSFGGREIEYPGTFTKYRIPV